MKGIIAARLRMWGYLYRNRMWWFQRKRRNEPPFRLYVGKRGRGKSLAFTADLQRELARGSVVIANAYVSDPLSQREAFVFGTMAEAFEAVHAAVMEGADRIIIGVDEAQNHFDARMWERTAKEALWFLGFLGESRHYHVGVIACTLGISNVDKRFRLLADEIIRVAPFIANNLHRFAVLRCTEFEENRESADEEARELGVMMPRYISARAFAGYSTTSLPSHEAVWDADQERITVMLDEMREKVSWHPEDAAGGPEGPAAAEAA